MQQMYAHDILALGNKLTKVFQSFGPPTPDPTPRTPQPKL